MVPRAVLMKNGLRTLNTARPVNTAHPKTIVYSARPMPNTAVVNVVRANQGHPQQEDQGYVDSGCSRHMTWNMSYLSDFKEFDRGYVTFRGGAKGGRITGKGTLKTEHQNDTKVIIMMMEILPKPTSNKLCGRSMIGSLMYLTASRPDIMFAICACARFQVTPKGLHLRAMKRIFKYLKGQPKLGLWYPKDSPFDLEAYTDSDYASASLDRKSTTGGCQFLGSRFISWKCRKQTIVATSTTEADFVDGGAGNDLDEAGFVAKMGGKSCW
ncbi:hypothetical protein Tco_0906142 [Tanacetum coccineum]